MFDFLSRFNRGLPISIRLIMGRRRFVWVYFWNFLEKKMFLLQKESQKTHPTNRLFITILHHQILKNHIAYQVFNILNEGSGVYRIVYHFSDVFLDVAMGEGVDRVCSLLEKTRDRIKKRKIYPQTNESSHYAA